MMTNDCNKGFSLIELIITIAILGVLSSIAIPQYTIYVKKAKVAEAVELTYAIRMSMENAYLKNRTFPKNSMSLADRNRSVGLPPPGEYESEVIERVWVGEGGVRGASVISGHIAVTVNADLEVGAGGGGAHAKMLLSTVEWTGSSFKFICGNTNVPWPTSIKPEFLPLSCQN